MSDKKLKFKFKPKMESRTSNVDGLRNAVNEVELSKNFDDAVASMQSLSEAVLSAKIKLTDLLDRMKEINVNIHPLQSHILEHWRQNLEEVIESITESDTEESDTEETEEE